MLKETKPRCRPSEEGELIPHNAPKPNSIEEKQHQTKQGPDDGARESQLEKIIFGE